MFDFGKHGKLIDWHFFSVDIHNPVLLYNVLRCMWMCMCTHNTEGMSEKSFFVITTNVHEWWWWLQRDELSEEYTHKK